MTFWTIVFVALLAVAIAPLAWLVGKAVGMERATAGRAALFALGQAAVGYLAMRFVPVDIFVIRAVAGLVAALLVSPLCFRLAMTDESARAILGSLLLAVAATALSVLLFIVF